MKKILCSFVFLLASVALHLQAQATLTFQGVVTNANGTALDDGKYPITFQLYDMASGGTALWSETHDEVSIIGGIYSVVLGAVNPITAAFDAPYYLGVAIDGGAELIPRVQLTAAPYALSLLGETNVFPNDGKVGIGTTDPLEKLHVVGNLKVEGSIDASGGVGVDFGNLAVDIKTTGNITLQDTLAVPGAHEELRLIRGLFDQNGVVSKGSGFTVEKCTTGSCVAPGWTTPLPVYKVTFDTPFSDTPNVYANTPHNNHYLGAVWTYNPDEVILGAQRISDGVYVSTGISFLVVGPR